MLIGYVSDERYVAQAGVLFEFAGEMGRIRAESSASGTVEADLPPGGGRFLVTFTKPGLGTKRVELNLPARTPYQFRLLSEELLGYAWPKWVKAGEKSEFRVHSSEAYKLSLWRYGWKKEHVRKIGWFDEHGPEATRQITPDGDYTQTGVDVEQVRLRQPASQAVRRGAGAFGPVLLSREDRVGPIFLVSVDRRAAEPAGEDRRARVEHHVERVQQFRRPQQLHPCRPTSTHADGQRPAGAESRTPIRGIFELRHGRLRSAVVRSAGADQSRSRRRSK